MEQINAYTALVGFAGFLTTRPIEMRIGAEHECAPIYELLELFTKIYNLDETFQSDILSYYAPLVKEAYDRLWPVGELE